jgi:Peptidase_C39 like family
MWAGAGVTSINRAGRITTFGFAVGAGLLIASGAGAAVAAAAPDESGHTSTSSSSVSTSSPSARSHRAAAASSTSTPAKPKPTRTVGTSSDHLAQVVQLHTGKRTPVAASTSAVSPATDNVTAAPKQVPALPTPAEFQQAIVAGLGTARRSLDDLRQKIEVLVQHQIDGFQENLFNLRIDLERVFNPGKPIIYGNLANSQYWAAGGAQTANLMAAAMVISALKGQTMTAQDIITEAMNTDSIAQPNRKMYRGTDTFDWVKASDAVQLLENHGIEVSTVYYTKSQDQRAWNGIVTALTQGKSVIVAINGKVGSSREGNEEVWTVQHQVVLVGINVTKNLVYLNDGAYPLGGGQNLTMSIPDFMDAWQESRYTAIFAELAPATAQATSSAARESIAA